MTLTTTPFVPAAVPSAWSVVRRLAWAEAKRMLRHPVLLLTVALAAYMLWIEHSGSAPVLNRVGASTSWPLLLIGGGGLLVACDAAIRMWRTEQSEAIDIAPVSDRVRIAALLLASLTPVVLAWGLQAVTLMAQVLNRPVTSLDIPDVVTGGVVVATMTVFGVAAGRWLPSRFTGPLTLVVGFTLSIVLTMYRFRVRFGDVITWFGLFVPPDGYTPAEVAFRPSGSHLIYLLGILGLLTVLASLKGMRNRRVLALVALLVSGGLVAVGSIGQVRAYQDYDREAVFDRHLPPAADHRCETRGTVEYCVLPGYQAWIDEWVALVQPVIALAPNDVAARPFTVQQYPSRLLDRTELYRRNVQGDQGLATGTWWSRSVGTEQGRNAYPFGMALGAASRMVGLPVESTLARCNSINQGRAVVAFWMAAQASETTEQFLRDIIERPDRPIQGQIGDLEGNITTLLSPYFHSQHTPWWPIIFTDHEARYAHHLLSRPADAVVSSLHANWSELTDPSTTTARAVEIFGLELEPGHEASMESDQRTREFPRCR